MFGTEGAPVSEVDNPSGLCTAVQSIRGGQANCVLVIGLTKQAQLGAKDIQIVELLASESGANRALGDSKFAKPQKASESPAPFVGTSGLAALCGLVWQLRGWAYNRPATQAQNTLLYTSNSAGGASVVILERSDGRVALQWDEVKDVRDGRERLGYNPAVEERSISHEDLEAVRARKEYTNEDGVKRLGLSAKGGDRAALSRL
ncbi:unnamed protein product [Zymoseptoria tritici ST99CH_3D1]|nr:unnamed protein product [Zymoseptoria tritici ST99CH_3D1]